MTTSQSQLPAWLANVLWPGLGHVAVREYAFGLFVYLITLLATGLLAVFFFIDLPWWSWLVLLGLPVVFYLFTFVDLNRSLKRNRKAVSLRRWGLVLIAGLMYQVFSPTAPVNFLRHNPPGIARLEHTHFSPLHRPGDLLVINPLAYRVKIPFIEKPVFYRLPERFDLVRVTAESGSGLIGLVIGFPGETIEAVDGVILVDGYAHQPSPAHMIPVGGDCPLTTVDNYSILVASLRLGRIDKVYERPLEDVDGRVSSLF